ncbi:MAG: hypothetical protein HQL82_16650 [Magnetococcales bacterium]|nr:hypothetical protein [Magnetococcales bacterium]
MQRLRDALARTPHAPGDHTDLCRHHNAGLSPRDPSQCRCHVAAVTAALAATDDQATRQMQGLIQAARRSRELLLQAILVLQKTGTPPAGLDQALDLLAKALDRLDGR